MKSINEMAEDIAKKINIDALIQRDMDKYFCGGGIPLRDEEVSSLNLTIKTKLAEIIQGDISMKSKEETLCPDCGVKPGEKHLDFCDVERCPACGGQCISCGCGDDSHERMAWTGEWPGVAECREFGWYSKMVPGQGWISCDKDEPGASENLNRLYIDARWDTDKRRFVKK